MGIIVAVQEANESEPRVKLSGNHITHTHTYTQRTKTTQTEGHSDTQSVSQSRASWPLYHSAGTIQNPLD